MLTVPICPCPLFFFSNEVFPCFVFAFIIIKTVPKTPNNWAVKSTGAPVKQAPVISPFRKSGNSLVSQTACNIDITNYYRYKK